ncbi:hypothetical protein GCL60_01090 [Silvanigrella paludirubra]|uniref:Uncharacterized protein n=1 Tax=Silvanigrella paludirubra TaxID=2499159 RepID=A0A6N6VZ71_9BACT|nr:hypothetical protein [Silvanigrella paludirubra]KAB8040542.1 hypothetical protein GCL60_01090 [Silvanigrella paludirubra]
MKNKKSVLSICFLVVTLTLYSIIMLWIHFIITKEMNLKISKLYSIYPEIQNIEYKGISLSPLFIINKKFNIDNLFIKVQNIPFELLIKKIEINDFFIFNNDFFPIEISSESIQIYNLEVLKENIKKQDNNLNQFYESIYYFLNSPKASFHAKYQSNQYSIDLRFYLKNNLILNSSYHLNNFNPVEKSKNILYLKNFKINLEDIPLNTEKVFPKNTALQEVLGNNYKNLLINLNINYNSTQNNEKEANLNANIEIQRIINIKILSHFIIYNLVNLNSSSFEKTLFQFTDQNFLDEYYKNESIKKNKSIEQVKNDMIKQNNLLLIFISNPIIEKALQEMNNFIKNPKTLSIFMNPENPISIDSFLKLAKEDYFGLLKLLNIKFESNKNFIEINNEEYFH